MKIKANNKTVEAITIKELYKMAVEQGKENAIIGISYNNTDISYCPECDNNIDIDIEYVEEVQPTDIEFGGYYQNRDKICDCVWLNNHAL